MNGARILGTTEDYTGCDCCGRANLKVYVVIDHDGEIRHYGTSCAAIMLKADAADIRKAAKAADKAAEAAAAAARREAAAAEYAAWKAFLDTAAGPGDTADQVRHLGGITAARAAYRAV